MNTQWHAGKPGFTFIYGPHGEEIAQVSQFQFTREDAQALAAQIVREHNAHNDLVAALRICLAAFDGYKQAGILGPRDEAIDKLRAALAKAGAL